LQGRGDIGTSRGEAPDNEYDDESVSEATSGEISGHRCRRSQPSGNYEVRGKGLRKNWDSRCRDNGKKRETERCGARRFGKTRDN